jgi:hypothetical protein
MQVSESSTWFYCPFDRIGLGLGIELAKPIMVCLSAAVGQLLTQARPGG